MSKLTPQGTWYLVLGIYNKRQPRSHDLGNNIINKTSGEKRRVQLSTSRFEDFKLKCVELRLLKTASYGDMSELVDESDLKSAEPSAREGSSPSIPTILLGDCL